MFSDFISIDLATVIFAGVNTIVFVLIGILLAKLVLHLKKHQ